MFLTWSSHWPNLKRNSKSLGYIVPTFACRLTTTQALVIARATRQEGVMEIWLPDLEMYFQR